MAPRLSRLILALASAVASGAVPGAASAQEGGEGAPWREVVTREMIDAAGLLRLGEVVRLAPQWNAATIDDFTWRAAPRALGAVGEDRWTLLLDGRPVGVGMLGVASLEHLPIDLASIDSIVFVSSPTLEGGVFTDAGLMHVHTAHPERSVSARGRLGFGSETGDPGPFAFLPDGGDNRDRYGHESAVEGAVRSGGWNAAGSYTASVHLPTDPLILERIYASSALTPRIERVAPALRLGREGGGGAHHLIAGMSRIDDWLRLELAGIEAPVRSTLAHVSAAGSARVAAIAVGYRAGFEHAHAETRPESAAPGFDFEWRTLRASVDVSARRGAPRIGVTVARRTGRREGAQSLGRESELGVFGEVRARSATWLGHHLAAAVSGRGNGLEGGLVLTTSLDAAPGNFSLRLSAARRPALAPMGLPGLAAQGDPWFEAAGISVTAPSPDQVVRTAAAELGWRTGGRHTRIAGSVFLRAFDGTPTTRRDLAWDPVFRAWRGPVTVEAGSGRRIGGHVGLRSRLAGNLEAAADLHLVKAFGDPLVRRATEPVPVIRGLVSTTWRPVEGFGVRGEAELETARRWPDHAAAARGPAKSHAEQPGGVTATLSAWKLFADGRLRGQFVARNLTGRRVILHPDGRASTLAFLFLLGASL